MSKPLLHVLFSPSGAGTLRQTLAQQGRADQVVCTYDDFSFGPIAGADAARIVWVDEELGVTGWESEMLGTAQFLEASCSIDALPIAWISRRDAKSYAGFLWWLSHLGEAPCKVIDVTDVTIGDSASSARRLAISPSAMMPDGLARLLDSEVWLGPADRQGYQARWEQLLRENASLRVVDDQGLLSSAPITYFDALLLSCATTAWQKMARVIGEGLASFGDRGVDQAGDLVLYGRARALAEAGALDWRGDLSSMRDCEVRLPPPPKDWPASGQRPAR